VERGGEMVEVCEKRGLEGVAVGVWSAFVSEEEKETVLDGESDRVPPPGPAFEVGEGEAEAESVVLSDPALLW